MPEASCEASLTAILFAGEFCVNLSRVIDGKPFVVELLMDDFSFVVLMMRPVGPFFFGVFFDVLLKFEM